MHFTPRSYSYSREVLHQKRALFLVHPCLPDFMPYPQCRWVVLWGHGFKGLFRSSCILTSLKPSESSYEVHDKVQFSIPCGIILTSAKLLILINDFICHQLMVLCHQIVSKNLQFYCIFHWLESQFFSVVFLPISNTCKKIGKVTLFKLRFNPFLKSYERNLFRSMPKGNVPLAVIDHFWRSDKVLIRKGNWKSAIKAIHSGLVKSFEISLGVMEWLQYFFQIPTVTGGHGPTDLFGHCVTGSRFHLKYSIVQDHCDTVYTRTVHACP